MKINKMEVPIIFDCVGWYYITELTDSIIQTELISAILDKDKLSVSTAKKAYNALNAYLKYAVYKRAIVYNPMAMRKLRGQNNTLTVK